MTLLELKTTIARNKKIPDDCYSLNGGLPNEALCIAHSGGKWEVYYSERGIKTNVKTFIAETTACEYFYDRLLRMLGI